LPTEPEQVETIVEKIVEKIVEVPREEVPKEEAECQTDIGMEYFDRVQPLQKADSRASGSSNKQRVGGGGSIIKPPKPVAKQNSSKLDPMNITGQSNPSLQPSQLSNKSGSGSQRNI
jgi:hypothetical protein